MQLAFYASVTGLDFFVIRWCCLASGWDVGPVSDYQLLCMKHRPIANGLSLDADVYKSFLPWLLLFESCSSQVMCFMSSQVMSQVELKSCSMCFIGGASFGVYIVFTV